MKLRENYHLSWLGETPYLLPFGQAAANLQRGVRLNHSGVVLWKAMCKGATEEELLELMIAECRPEEGDIPQFGQDLGQFLERLRACGLLQAENSGQDSFIPFVHRTIKMISIGGIRLAWFNQGVEKLDIPEFAPFCTDEYTMDTAGREKALSIADLVVTLTNRIPRCLPVGQILVRNAELLIAENEDGYLCIYPRQSGLREWHLSGDGRRATLYCRGDFPDTMAQDVFHAIRMIYLVLAQKRGLFAIHSASLLYRGKAWLFSGHSGAGKSTHTAIWKRLFDTPLLNGDLNLLELGEEGPVVHGMPWCGTSGISVTGDYPLGGIVFVRQNPTDRVLGLEESERALLISQRLISPIWTKEMFEENLEFSKKLAAKIPLFKLLCTKENSAAVVMKAEIDRFCDGI